MKKPKLKSLLISVAIPLLVGGTSALLSGSFSESYQTLKKPPLNPPPLVFPAVWSILYVLMGVSSWLVYQAAKSRESFRSAMIPYAVSLILNGLWTIIFFRFGLYWVGAFWVLAMIITILSMIKVFEPVSKKAAALQIPYLIWCCFAAYLSFGIAAFN